MMSDAERIERLFAHWKTVDSEEERAIIWGSICEARTARLDREFQERKAKSS